MEVVCELRKWDVGLEPVDFVHESIGGSLA